MNKVEPPVIRRLVCFKEGQQVDKSLVFAVQVTDIMLSALGQLGGGFQADNGAGSRGLGGIIPCQQRKIL